MFVAEKGSSRKYAALKCFIAIYCVTILFYSWKITFLGVFNNQLNWILNDSYTYNYSQYNSLLNNYLYIFILVNTPYD